MVNIVLGGQVRLSPFLVGNIWKINILNTNREYAWGCPRSMNILSKIGI